MSLNDRFKMGIDVTWDDIFQEKINALRSNSNYRKILGLYYELLDNERLTAKDIYSKKFPDSLIKKYGKKIDTISFSERIVTPTIKFLVGHSLLQLDDDNEKGKSYKITELGIEVVNKMKEGR